MRTDRGAVCARAGVGHATCERRKINIRVAFIRYLQAILGRLHTGNGVMMPGLLIRRR